MYLRLRASSHLITYSLHHKGSTLDKSWRAKIFLLHSLILRLETEKKKNKCEQNYLLLLKNKVINYIKARNSLFLDITVCTLIKMALNSCYYT